MTSQINQTTSFIHSFGRLSNQLQIFINYLKKIPEDWKQNSFVFKKY